MSDAAECAHDRFITAARWFREEPTFARASECIREYRAFYLAFAGEGGLEEAIAELRQRLARRIQEAA